MGGKDHGVARLMIRGGFRHVFGGLLCYGCRYTSGYDTLFKEWVYAWHHQVPRDQILYKHLQIHLLDSYNVDRGVSSSQVEPNGMKSSVVLIDDALEFTSFPRN